MGSMNKTKIQQNGWQKVKLGDVVDVRDGTHDSPKQKTDGKFLITSKNITGRKIDFSSAYKISEEDFLAINKRSKVDKWDILFSMIGTVAETVIIDFEPNFAIKNVGLFKCVNKDLATWIYYYLKSNQAKSEIYSRLRGSTQPYITLGDLRTFPIELPPLPEQKAIAEVLSSLDDKIDLLHRQNKTLEDMAQALFRKWFVEEAKEDWEKKTLVAIANYLNGLACQKYPPKNEIDKLPVLKIKELNSGFSDNSDWVTSEVDEKYLVEMGDIIFSWSGSLVLKIWDGQNCVLNQHLFKVSSDNYPKWFYYFWTKYYLQKFIGIADSKATTMGHIKRGDLTSSIVLVPKNEDLEAMSKTIAPKLDKIISNFKQIRTLENLRDTLLPKLMSGEVRVKF